MHGVCDPSLGDHYMTYIAKRRCKIRRSYTTIRGQNYRDFDEYKYKDEVSNESWNRVYEAKTATGVAVAFRDCLLKIIDKHAPMADSKCRNENEPWVTGEGISLVDTREH